MPDNMHGCQRVQGVPVCSLSICILHNIHENKGDPLPSPVEAEHPLAPIGTIPVNSETKAPCLAMHVQDALANSLSRLWA